MFTSRIFTWIYIKENALFNERHQTTIIIFILFFVFSQTIFFKERQRFVMQRSKNRLYQKNIESFFSRNLPTSQNSPNHPVLQLHCVWDSDKTWQIPWLQSTLAQRSTKCERKHIFVSLSRSEKSSLRVFCWYLNNIFFFIKVKECILNMSKVLWIIKPL